MVCHLFFGGGLPRGWRGNTRQRAHLSLFPLYIWRGFCTLRKLSRNCQIAHFSKLFDGLRRVAPGRGSLPLDDVCLSLLNMLYLQTLPFLQSGNREEVSDVDYLLNLLVAVIANVGGSLISKWLDNHYKKGK